MDEFAAAAARRACATAGSGSRQSGADVAASSAPSTASRLHSCAAAFAAASASRSLADFSFAPGSPPGVPDFPPAFFALAGVPGKDGCGALTFGLSGSSFVPCVPAPTDVTPASLAQYPSPVTGATASSCAQSSSASAAVVAVVGCSTATYRAHVAARRRSRLPR